jgi:hypothetical protein
MSSQKSKKKISDKKGAETQILAEQKIVDYTTLEYSVEIIVQKYLKGIEEDQNELFAPEYKREFVWDKKRQSHLIESILLDLPIPYFFTANCGERTEIVDGLQRIQTLVAFLKNDLTLDGLKRLDTLNGFKYADLLVSTQRRFKKKSLGIIELTDKADDEAKWDIFARINPGRLLLSDIKIRKGIVSESFFEFLAQCAENAKFLELCPIAQGELKGEERTKFVLRFFAYSERYLEFEYPVKDFLEVYIKDKKTRFDQREKRKLQQRFEKMLNFVDKYFPYGFKKSAKAITTPKIRFEALAVGTHLALQKKPNLVPPKVDWLNSEMFKLHTRYDASHSLPKVKARIEFVRDQLLGKL